MAEVQRNSAENDQETVPDPGSGSSATVPVTDRDRRAALRDDGYFTWPAMVPAPVIAAHLYAHAEHLADRAPYPSAAFAALPRAEQLAVFDADYAWHARSPHAQNLFWRPDLVAFLHSYFGTEPVLRYPQTGLRHRNADLHADGITPWVDPPGADLRVWIALEDIDPAAGPVYFVPGSHRHTATVHTEVLAERPDFRTALDGAEAKRAANPTARNPTYAVISYANAHLAQTVRTLRLPRVVPMLSAGDAVVFRTDLAHGTMPCADETLTRKHALVFFSAADAVWHSESTYWGADHDHRTPDNAVRWQRTRTGHGLAQVAAP